MSRRAMLHKPATYALFARLLMFDVIGRLFSKVMEKLFWNIVKWLLYSAGFLAITLPITIHFNFGVWEKISISLLLGFFAGIFNEISSTLQSINNQLRGRS